MKSFITLHPTNLNKIAQGTQQAKTVLARLANPIFQNIRFTLSALVLFFMPFSSRLIAQTPAESDMTFLTEGHGKAFYIHVDAAPDDENEIGQHSLYMKDLANGSFTRLFQTSPYGKEGSKLKIKKEGIYTDGETEIIDEIVLLSESKILISGCPDARNIYSYIYDLTTGKAVFLDVYSGYVDTVEEDGRPLIKMSTYAYRPNGGGRYGIYVYFDMEGNKIRKEDAPEDEDY